MPNDKDVLEQLEAKRRELTATEQALVEAEAAFDTDAAVTLRQRIDVLRSFMARLEVEARAATEANGRKKAEQRMLGIKRALGSVNASMDDDQSRVNKAKAEYEEAIERINARYRQAAQLRAEGLALADRFGIPDANLPQVTPPAARDLTVKPSVGLLGHLHLRPDTEKCEHGLRERRTYTEVRSTEGYQIIEAVGLKAFPPLTAKQQHIIDEQAREGAEARRQLSQVPLIPADVGPFSGTL